MKYPYQLFSVPAMADTTLLEKRLHSLLKERRRSSVRHHFLPLALGGLVLGLLVPVRPITRPIGLTLGLLGSVAHAEDKSAARTVELKLRVEHQGKVVMQPKVLVRDRTKGTVIVENQAGKQTVTITPRIQPSQKAITLEIQHNQDKPLQQEVKPGKEAHVPLSDSTLYVTVTLRK